MYSFSMQGQISLADMFGPCVYSPRPSHAAGRWLPHGEVVQNTLSGGQLVLAEETPVICCRGISTPAGLDLLKAAGFTVPDTIFRFSSRSEYLELLSHACRNREKIVVNHSFPEDELPSEHCWIPTELHNFLNNKKNLSLIASVGTFPRREKMKFDKVAEKGAISDFPVVIKIVADVSSGGGAGVVICHNRIQLHDLLQKLSGAEEVIVEEFLNIVSSHCLNYAIDHGGRITFLGAAEQVVSEDGTYLGNWLEYPGELPESAREIADQVAEAAVGFGYYGMLGVDVAVLEDGRVLLLDLNFRANGSTAALNFQKSICEYSGKTVFRLRSWIGSGDYPQLLKQAGRFLEKGMFIPLWSYDPSVDGHNDSPRIGGLILGASREEVVELERQLEGEFCV